MFIDSALFAKAKRHWRAFCCPPLVSESFLFHIQSKSMLIDFHSSSLSFQFLLLHILMSYTRFCAIPFSITPKEKNGMEYKSILFHLGNVHEPKPNRIVFRQKAKIEQIDLGERQEQCVINNMIFDLSESIHSAIFDFGVAIGLASPPPARHSSCSLVSVDPLLFRSY